jgi:hypothetical protein
VQRYGGSAGVEALPGLSPFGAKVVDNYCGVNSGATRGFHEKPTALRTESETLREQKLEVKLQAPPPLIKATPQKSFGSKGSQNPHHL